MDINSIMSALEAKHPGEKEYLQAVREVLMSVEEVYNQHPEFERNKIIERMVEPDRIVTFRVTWIDDKGEVQNNIGYRVQFNNAIGPYKGGIRFHASVNLSILKFLGFEQTFKNALTTLPMGGAKGGSDFSPRGKSDREIMRFCQAFMLGLWKNLGPDRDVPAGDIGVGGREVGYMYGMYKRLVNQHDGTFTGKALEFGGSRIDSETTDCDTDNGDSDSDNNIQTDTDETDSETTDCDTDSTDSETTDCDTDNGDSDSDNNIQTDTEETDSETTDCDTDSTESETTDCDTDSTDSETTDCDTDSTDSDSDDNIQTDTDETDSETTDCDTDSNSTDSYSDDNSQTDTDETDSESETNNSDKSEHNKTNPSNKITHNTQSVDAYYSPNIGAAENSAVTSPVPEKSAMKTGDKSSSVRFAAVWSMLIAALTVISLLFAKKRSKNEKGEAE